MTNAESFKKFYVSRVSPSSELMQIQSLLSVNFGAHLQLWHSCDVIISLSFFLAADYGVQFLYVLFWGGAVMMTLYVVLYFGNEYVDQPRLVQVQAKDKNV